MPHSAQTSARAGTSLSPAAGAVIGLAAGFASSFLGIGGGLVMVPALASVAGFPIKRAIGTSLAAIAPVAAAGVIVESYVKGENIHWGAAALLTAGAIAGSLVGARLLARSSAARLRWLLIAVLLIAAVKLSGLLSVSSATRGADSFAPFVTPHEGWGVAACIALGALGGVASSLFGIGGGIVVVPGLTLLFSAFAFHGARATSLVMIVPTSIFGAMLHSRLGTIDAAAIRRLVPTALAGSVAGVILANRLPEGPLRAAFCLYLLFASARLARSSSVTLPPLPPASPATP